MRIRCVSAVHESACGRGYYSGYGKCVLSDDEVDYVQAMFEDEMDVERCHDSDVYVSELQEDLLLTFSCG